VPADVKTPIEGFGRLECHVIVNRSSEAIEIADRPPAPAPAPAPARDVDRRDAAFVRLADEHLDKAYRLARAILRDPAEAQDATHDAFVQAWRKWETLRDPSRFEPWFDRILVNTCRNRLRSSRRQATDISAEVALSTGDHTGQAEARDVIGAAIAGLSPDHQVVVALRYYRDLTVDEIARRLDIPRGTVQSRLHYALKRLHEAIGAAETEGTVR
jgi:RNA polymerase sigma-70 factor (ECF subfamily)